MLTIIVTLIVIIWYVCGYIVCVYDPKKNKKNINKQYKKFIKSDTWKTIQSLEPIQYSSEPHDADFVGDDY